MHHVSSTYVLSFCMSGYGHIVSCATSTECRYALNGPTVPRTNCIAKFLFVDSIPKFLQLKWKEPCWCLLFSSTGQDVQFFHPFPLAAHGKTPSFCFVSLLLLLFLSHHQLSIQPRKIHILIVYHSSKFTSYHHRLVILILACLYWDSYPKSTISL